MNHTVPRKQKKIHFMHIPKTGGSSLQSFLDQQFKFEDIFPGCYIHKHELPRGSSDALVLNNYSRDEIRHYSFFRQHLGWIPRLYFSSEEIDTIVFLRDPIERMLSNYDFHASTLPNFSKRWRSLNDFIWDTNTDFLKANIQTKVFCLEHFAKENISYAAVRTFTDEFYSPSGQVNTSIDHLLQLATARLHQCAFIGITEKYEESFESLCTQFNWIPPTSIPRLNVTSSRTQRHNLTPRVLDRIIELNQLDIQLYQEAVKLFEDRKRIRIPCNFDSRKEKKYENLPQQREIQFSFADKIIGEGWHHREGSTRNNIFCWSSSPEAILYFCIKGKYDFLISFHVVHILIPEFLDELTLSVNSHPIALHYYLHSEEGYVFEGVMPNTVLQPNNPLLKLVFSLPQVVKPCDVDPNSTDARELGFACKTIQIKPVPPRHYNHCEA